MTLNIGVIGTGAIGREHIRRCSQVLQNARVVALNDINRANCEQILTDLALKAEIYDNAHDLINAPDVQAILVTSWGPTHEEFVLAAIKAGKAVFCEKPLAVTAQGCMNIVEAEIASGKSACRLASCARTIAAIVH